MCILGKSLITKKDVYEVASSNKIFSRECFLCKKLLNSQADLSAILNSIEIRSPFLDNTKL